MRRAHPQQRREAKIARRRARLKARDAASSERRDRDHMARVILGQHNLTALVQRAEVVADNATRRKPRKLPKLVHYHGPIPQAKVRELVG